MPDSLTDWLRVRELVDWRRAATADSAPVRGRRDGFLEYVQASGWSRGEERARRLVRALRVVRAAVETDGLLTYELLADWQTVVLGVDSVEFRTGPAFAKEGREVYDLHPGIHETFDRCLTESTELETPLAARAARVYLDVAFFHPFPDGNARAAMLAMYFVLLRGEVMLDLAAPILIVSRRADDLDGARDLVRLIDVLIEQTRHRAARGPHCRTASEEHWQRGTRGSSAQFGPT